MREKRRAGKDKRYLAILLTLLITLLMALGLSACSNEDKKQAAPSKKTDNNNNLIGGLWLHGEGKIALTFDGIISFMLETENATITGTYSYDGKVIKLYDKDELIYTGSKDRDELITFDNMDGYFYREELNSESDTEELLVPYFEENNLFCNYELGMGAQAVDKGSVYYKEDGSAYILARSDWEVFKTSDTIAQDGYREIEFTAICYFPAEYNPNLAGKYKYSTTSALCDYYTGLELPAGNTAGSTGPGQNYHNYSFDVFGETVNVEYDYVVSWRDNEGNYLHVMEKNYTVRFPASYDGLVFCACPQQNTFEESTAAYRRQKTLTTMEPMIDGCPQLSEALRCRIN